MRNNWRLWVGIAAVIATTTYLALAYFFMWSPVVTQCDRCLRTTENKALTEHTCLHNLRQIDAAIMQYAFEHGKSNGTPISMDQIKPYFPKEENFRPTEDGFYCPAGGIYAVTVVGASPTCSIGTNLTDRVRIGHFHWENPAFHMLQ